MRWKVNLFQALLLAIVLAVSGNCASLYVQNRVNDARDIFTAEVQTQSYGLSVRAGPVKAGLLYKSADGYSGGLRGGTAGSYDSQELTLVIFGSDSFAKKRETPKTTAPQTGSAKTTGTEKEIAEIPDPRRKEFNARSPFGTLQSMRKTKSVLKGKTQFAPPYYYTQIEVTAGVYFGLKIGINPGELLDFLLGFVGIDIMGDDLLQTDPDPIPQAGSDSAP